MNRTMTINETRPKNGCARCVWWFQDGADGWGLCAFHRERTWWQHAACVEYETDGQIGDTIRLQLKTA